MHLRKASQDSGYNHSTASKYRALAMLHANPCSPVLVSAEDPRDHSTAAQLRHDSTRLTAQNTGASQTPCHCSASAIAATLLHIATLFACMHGLPASPPVCAHSTQGNKLHEHSHPYKIHGFSAKKHQACSTPNWQQAQERSPFTCMRRKLGCRQLPDCPSIWHPLNASAG